MVEVCGGGTRRKKKEKRNQKPISKRVIPEVLEGAVAFLGDLSGHSMLLAVYSIQPMLHYNLADHLVGPQWEQELLDLQEKRGTLLLQL